MFFRTRHCTCVHCLGCKNVQNWKKGCVFGHIDKFWKEHDRQIKKNACKNAYLGSFFIPEKYVIRVLFVSPWTSLIPPLAIRVPPPPPPRGCALRMEHEFCCLLYVYTLYNLKWSICFIIQYQPYSHSIVTEQILHMSIQLSITIYMLLHKFFLTTIWNNAW